MEAFRGSVPWKRSVEVSYGFGMTTQTRRVLCEQNHREVRGFRGAVREIRFPPRPVMPPALVRSCWYVPAFISAMIASSPVPWACSLSPFPRSRSLSPAAEAPP